MSERFSNFTFLKQYWEDLAEIGENLEGYIYSDPSISIAKTGMLSEQIVKKIFAYEKLPVSEDTSQVDLINILRREGIIPNTIDSILYTIRKARNNAIHRNEGDVAQAKTIAKLGFKLACWFMELYGDWQFEIPEYIDVPDNKENLDEIKRRLEKQDEKIDDLLKNVELIQTKVSNINAEEKSKQSQEIANSIDITPQESVFINKDAIRLDVSSIPAISYSMQQNGFIPIKSINIDNKTENDLESIKISVVSSPKIFKDYESEIGIIPAGESVSKRDIKLLIDVDYLINLVERQKAIISIKLTDKDQNIITEELVDIDVLAYDQWTGVNIYPELLSAFVTPNHPYISTIISNAAAYLKKWTPDNSFDGYQSEEKNKVQMQCAAIYSAIQALEIEYVDIPASYSDMGQRIRLCDQVIDKKIGNCIDIALLFASCLEAVGLNPILCIKPGHIFPGVWLIQNTLPDATSDDNSVITKRLADGVDEIRVVETTLLTYGKNVSFDEASAVAEDEITDYNPVDLIIDVKSSRAMKIIPLPSRIMTGEGYIIERNDMTSFKPNKPELIKDYGYDFDQKREFDRKTQWERKLLDLGLKNSLINLHLSKSIVPILATSIDALEDELNDGDSFTIYPKPENWKNSDIKDDFYSLTKLGDFTNFIDEEFKSHRVHSSLTESELSSTLKVLYRNARTSLEENGANTLFVAVGLLKWYEPKKNFVEHYAPIFLLPVEIKKKSITQGYTISLRKDDEPQVNITILEKLKQDYGITIPGLDVLPEDEHGVDIRRVLTIFRNAILNQNYWDVLETAFLGIFSFSQFVLWNDIHNRSEDLEKSKIVKSLIEGHLTWESNNVSKEEANNTKDSYLTMPVDGSQLYAIKEAEYGESFVLHGPPGTGKSQTITSIIADLLAKGKKVLFVAEKRAALEVVQKRITELGLDAFCLELHSNKAKKKDVLEKIDKVFEITSKAPNNYEDRLLQLEELKKDLDVYVSELHEQRECGSSLYETLNKYESVQNYNGNIEIPFKKIGDFTDLYLDEQLFAIDELIISAKAIGHPNKHPLKGINILQYHQGIENEISDIIKAYLPIQNRFVKLIEELSKELELPLNNYGTSYENNYRKIIHLEELDSVPSNLLNLDSYENEINYLSSICDKKIANDEELNTIQKIWDGTALSENAKNLLDEYANIQSSNIIAKTLSLNKFIKRMNVYSKTELNKENVLNNLHNLVEYQKNATDIENTINTNISRFGDLYRYDGTDWRKVKQTLMEANQCLSDADSVFNSSLQRKKYASSSQIKESVHSLKSLFTDFVNKRKKLFSFIQLKYFNGQKWYVSEEIMLRALLENTNLIKDWAKWNKECIKAEQKELQTVVDAYYSGVDHNQISGIYKKSFYKKLAELIIDDCSSLNGFSGELFERKVEQFRKYDNQMRELTKQQVYYLIASRVKNYIEKHKMDINLAKLKKLIRSKGRGVSIRKLFQEASDVIQSLCPCLLMSPISTAQYLDPSTKKFDVVIFDEASQLQTCKAVGAIARAENAIIVGDPKQMPPTNFFSSNITDEDNADKEDLESILDDSLAINMPQSYLNWHYRSNHESLIAFSNNQFYGNKLYTFPSLNDRESKVKLINVNGVYSLGKNRTNEKEADEIIAEIKRRFEDPVLSKDSIGIVTFNVNQQNLIEDKLNIACARNKELDEWVNNPEEPLFIKNLESVQGDERDIIMFSITYGPDEKGKVSMNFGPLNKEGGWRRLNVAVSRARKEMLVFTSMLPEQINTNRTRAEGVAALKNFLYFALNNKLQLDSETLKKNNDKNAIIETICSELSKHGYSYDKMVGHSDFKIDICVIDPDNEGQYLLGILLDGEVYANSNFTRDRELSQIDILKNLGWKTIRIWSMDWWNDKNKQITRILNALEKAKGKPLEESKSKEVEVINSDENYINEANKDETPSKLEETINNESIMSIENSPKQIQASRSLISELKNAGFKIIDDRKKNNLLWIIADDSYDEDLFSQLTEGYDLKCTNNGIDPKTGKEKSVWRLVGYDGE